MLEGTSPGNCLYAPASSPGSGTAGAQGAPPVRRRRTEAAKGPPPCALGGGFHRCYVTMMPVLGVVSEPLDIRCPMASSQERQAPAEALGARAGSYALRILTVRSRERI